MDGQMRVFAVVVGMVFILGTAFVVMSSNAFNYTPVPGSEDFQSNTGNTRSVSRRTVPRNIRNIQPTVLASDRVATRARLARLESLLEDRTNELRKGQVRIDELNRQLRALRTTVPSPDEGEATEPRPSAAPADPPLALNSDLREEIERLNGELLNADIDAAEHQEQIAVLRDALAKANETLDVLEDGSDLQLSISRRQGREREAIMGDLVVRLGANSVPLLIDMLEEDDPNLRIWAIQVLGRFGEDADEAVEDISAFFEDESPEVRAAARKAIEAIEGR